MRSVPIRFYLSLALAMAGSSGCARIHSESVAAQNKSALMESSTVNNVASVPLVAKLGGLHRPILTAAPRASRYFDDGLQLHYAYRHAESVRAFREAQRLDSTCVMCAVGEAIALGPSVDAAMDSVAAGEATVAARRAQSLLSALPAGHPDSAWVRAITVRYPTGGETRSARDSAYVRAMGALADANPADADAQALAAEARGGTKNGWPGCALA